jgi:hypothetical protein
MLCELTRPRTLLKIWKVEVKGKEGNDYMSELVFQKKNKRKGLNLDFFEK